MAFPTLATHYDHQILGNEYCSGYADVFSKWNNGFYCPQAGTSLAVYCCGTPVFKYCCTTKQSTYTKGDGTGLDEEDDITSLYLSDTPVIIAIACGMAAVLILVIIASCFYCSCCFVYKKRLHVPGMYRMEDSSTTSGLASFQTSQSQSQLPTTTDGIHPRPIPPREQYIMTSPNIIGSESSETSSSPMDPEWSQPHQSQPSHFHINNNRSSGISSNHCVNLLPPPARFASNQNLSSNTNIMTTNPANTGIPLLDRNNPRDILSQYQNQNYGAPYSLTSTPSSGQSSATHQSYNTSTLPSCLRRAAANAAANGPCNNTVGQGQQQQQQQNQPQQLKSILRNARNPNDLNNSCVTTYRRATMDYDFCDTLLPLNTCYDSYDHNNYSNRHPQPSSNEAYHNYNRPFTPQGSINSGRYYSSSVTPNATLNNTEVSTEYQNDLNRFGQDIDPESLSRLIELDLDSKL